MNRRLEGKVAIITGAGTGIGEAIARKFVLEGASVVLNGLPDDPVADVVKDLRARGADVASYVGDVAQIEHAEECVQTAINRFGKLDILVNNAGAFPEIEFTEEYSLESFEQMIHSNIRTAFVMTKVALPHLQEAHGCIVSAGSESAENGIAQNTAYGGTKGFMHAFMKGVAVEQAANGVRANCVAPGPVDTAWTHKETSDMPKQMEKMLVQGTALGRRATPEEIANVYAFLASDEASFVTGACWLVDGAMTVAKGPVGDLVPRKLRKQPEGVLELEHEYDGRS